VKRFNTLALTVFVSGCYWQRGTHTPFRPYASDGEQFAEDAGHRGQAPEGKGSVGGVQSGEADAGPRYGTVYGHLGIDDSPTHKEDGVSPQHYCATLSARAKRVAAWDVVWSVSAGLLSTGLIATGTAWGAVGSRYTDDQGRMGDAHKGTLVASIVFPVAGTAVLPLAAYFMGRARENWRLASSAALGVNAPDPGKTCNAALSASYEAQVAIIESLQADMEKSLAEATQASADLVSLREAATAGRALLADPNVNAEAIGAQVARVEERFKTSKNSVAKLNDRQYAAVKVLAADVDQAVTSFREEGTKRYQKESRDPSATPQFFGERTTIAR
jgi:hypothetical protein